MHCAKLTVCMLVPSDKPKRTSDMCVVVHVQGPTNSSAPPGGAPPSHQSPQQSPQQSPLESHIGGSRAAANAHTQSVRPHTNQVCILV